MPAFLLHYLCVSCLTCFSGPDFLLSMFGLAFFFFVLFCLWWCLLWLLLLLLPNFFPMLLSVMLSTTRIFVEFLELLYIPLRWQFLTQPANSIWTHPFNSGFRLTFLNWLMNELVLVEYIVATANLNWTLLKLTNCSMTCQPNLNMTG